MNQLKNYKILRRICPQDTWQNFQALPINFFSITTMTSRHIRFNNYDLFECPRFIRILSCEQWRRNSRTKRQNGDGKVSCPISAEEIKAWRFSHVFMYCVLLTTIAPVFHLRAFRMITRPRAENSLLLIDILFALRINTWLFQWMLSSTSFPHNNFPRMHFPAFHSLSRGNFSLVFSSCGPFLYTRTADCEIEQKAKAPAAYSKFGTTLRSVNSQP